MAKLSREAREELAATRLLRVLAKHSVANARTLEQKISDAGNLPDARMTKFIGTNIWTIAAAARARFEAHKDLLEPFSTGEMSYQEFAARVRRRTHGRKEDNDFEEGTTQLDDFTE